MISNYLIKIGIIQYRIFCVTVFDLNEDESDDEIENEDPFIENESLFSPQETDLSMDTLDGFFSFFRNLFGKSESKNGVQLRNKGSSFWMRLLERIGYCLFSI